MKSKSDQKMVSIKKSEYEALVQCAQVTHDYLNGKARSFSHPDELLKHLNEPDHC